MFDDTTRYVNKYIYVEPNVDNSAYDRKIAELRDMCDRFLRQREGLAATMREVVDEYGLDREEIRQKIVNNCQKEEEKLIAEGAIAKRDYK